MNNTNNLSKGLETIQSPIFDLSIFEVIDGKINLTKIGNHFGKKVANWAKSQTTKDFIEAFESDIPNGASALESLKGGDGSQGTFTPYREIALEFTRWISPKFAVWANKQIDTLLQTGKVELSKQKELTVDDILQLNTNLIVKLRKENERLSLETTVLATRDLQPKTQREFKWIKNEIQADRGRTINYYVTKLFFDGDYKQAHQNAKQAYRQATGINIPETASLMSLDQKRDYLLWLSKQADKN